ncbi:putative DNA-binding domain-containing protein [Vibrio sp. Y2-5]|uniref:HvfC/BufC N-terminal domain-containing protein n=1 Tax=Vibrio sp. Y2-5 TaxID=2743977 RepID=UPI0016607EBA|nr:DNA-binding domain-containing protein [Vibrio sp. Y2-5]MBD0788698.1 putative DNA-binding domain-containing protein [Vibrio sp. Y2-5]
MSFGLAHLQATFAEGLRYQARGETCNIKCGQISAEERLQIYRNNFVMSLTEVLQATYPMLKEVLGEECFDAIARHYILSHPLKQGDVSGYGKHFNQTVALFPNVVEAAPYAVELARFEWTLDRTQQEFGKNERLSLQQLEAISTLSEQQHASLILHLYSWVFPFTSDFAVFDLQRAFSQQNFDNLILNNTQFGVIACDEHGHPWTKDLNREEYQLLTNINNKTPLGKIPPEALAALQSLLTLNVVAGFSLADHY